ncbi:hypothetical protein F66182_4748 [Fusarium sp. NRRL 66182]|nr:hypothetical protein F66182_4748 [Fusarium sp. NRRL 66182]
MVMASSPMDLPYPPASTLGHYSAPENVPKPRLLPSRSSLSLQATIRNITDQGPVYTSNTWTTSSGEHGILSDVDELEDRASFVQEYNRLAKKVNHTLHDRSTAELMVPEWILEGKGLGSPRKQGWLYRFLRSSSSHPPTDAKPTVSQAPRHKRSVSDLAHSLVHCRRESPKTLDLQSMIRISGKSMFYLPAEHAPSALTLPTCLRATAHYIAQHITTRGIFRIPGSIRVVNMLFDYYCCTEHGNADITGTVRSANLPMHVQASVHDVASTFKRLLSVIPGGILGSLSLFDALVAIHSQLQGDPEFPRTKQTKVRARLIALAIATVESQFRRELICAVFGLLSLIGRVAEITPREDEEGRALPTGDLMGYNALGIVFGPLILGDLLGLYSMKLATPKSGLMVLPLKSPKSRQDRNRRKTFETDISGPPTVDKIIIANSITEMLIVNWRDVVRQMKSLGMSRQHELRPTSPQSDSPERMEPSNFVIKKPKDWDREWRGGQWEDEIVRESSPEQSTPTLGISRQRTRTRTRTRTRPRSRTRGSSTSKTLVMKPSVGVLSPTVEESTPDEEDSYDTSSRMRSSGPSEGGSQNQRPEDVGLPEESHNAGLFGHTNDAKTANLVAVTPTPVTRTNDAMYRDSPRVSEDDVPPRTSSKQATKTTPLQQASTKEPAHPATLMATSKEAVPIERRGAIRKKYPGKNKLQQMPQQPIAVEWLEPGTRSPGVSATGISDSSSTRLEFSFKQEALEAALKAHHDELEQLDSSDHQKKSSPDICTQPKLQTSPVDLDSTWLNRDWSFQKASDVSLEEPKRGSQCFLRKDVARVSSGALEGLPNVQDHSGMAADQIHGEQKPEDVNRMTVPLHDAEGSEQLQFGRVVSLPIATPKVKSQQETTTPWFSIPMRKQRASTQPDMSPTNKQGGVKAMAAKFEDGARSTETSPAQPRSESRTRSLISHFSQYSPAKDPHSTRSVSTLGRYCPRKDSISSQNQLHSRNPSVGTNILGLEASGQDLRASIREEAAMRAIELQQAEKERKQSRRFQEQTQMLAQRQIVPPRKPVPGEKGSEASLQNPLSLGTMIPHPEQPPIAQHLHLVRPSSSISSMQHGIDPLAIPHTTPTPIPRPGSTSTLHAQVRSLQRQLDLKIEETIHLRRQLEVQGDADIGTLSQQLREAKREAQMWRERAESAERRIKVFERFTARLKGIREAIPNADQDDVDKGSKLSHHTGRTETNGQQENTFLESTVGYDSDTSGKTEDASVVQARIRKCLHLLTDGPLDSPSSMFSQTQDTNLSERPGRDISQSTVDIWMAAQDLLHLDETQGQNK